MRIGKLVLQIVKMPAVVIEKAGERCPQDMERKFPSKNVVIQNVPCGV